MPECSDIRKQWDEDFDGDRSPAAVVFQHLAECKDCRFYAGTAAGVRDALRELPLGGVDDEADQAVLRALRADRSSAAPARRPVLPLVFAGAGSFALTMIVAGVMLLASETPGGPAPRAVPGVAAQPRYIVVDPDAPWNDWLASPGLVAGVRGLRSIVVPAPPKPSPMRGDRMTRERVA